MFWGYSEALDLYAEFAKTHNVNDKSYPVVNILLVGCSDPRHIIKTLAKSYRHETRFNFYVIEALPALIGRHMLLVALALESADCLSTLAKVHTFMDIYGNILLRPTSARYMHSKAVDLIDHITDFDSTQSIFDFGHLKYADRDAIVAACGLWRETPANRFDVAEHWERRLRQHLGERYDARRGLFDWDHQMRLKDNGAQQICTQEYRHWRETGVAFTFPEYRQTHGNRSLAGTVPDCVDADISVGPFATFGLACDDSSYLKAFYGQNEYRATDITERNLFELFYEIQEREPFDATTFTAHKLGTAQLDHGKRTDDIRTEAQPAEEMKKFSGSLPANCRIQIIYLSIKDFEGINMGHRSPATFDVVCIGRSYFQLIQPSICHSLASDALILFETFQISVERKENIAKFLQKVRDAANRMNLTPVTKLNINLPLPVVRYKYRPPDRAKSPEQSE